MHDVLIVGYEHYHGRAYWIILHGETFGETGDMLASTVKPFIDIYCPNFEQFSFITKEDVQDLLDIMTKHDSITFYYVMCSLFLWLLLIRNSMFKMLKILFLVENN